jgi:YD repeat-containing protein
MSNVEIAALKLMVRGAYDLQKLRIQCGLRLCANFRAKLKDIEDEEEDKDEDLEKEENEEGEASETPKEKEELSSKAKNLIKTLKASYQRLTDGIAKNRNLPSEEGFNGDELISAYSELVLVDQYLKLENQEKLHFNQMESTLNKIPIYREYLRHEIGIGPAMASVLITYFDPAKAIYPSQFWKYAGLDVGPDGMGRSRRQEHLIEVSYLDKEGNKRTKMGLTYNPFLKTKLSKVLTTSFLRSGSRWRQVYDGYKHRLETDPAREKLTVIAWKKRKKAGEDIKKLWTPGRIHNASMRYMLKMFLLELWTKWRTIEGLPVVGSYHEVVMGHKHHGTRKQA